MTESQEYITPEDLVLMRTMNLRLSCAEAIVSKLRNLIQDKLGGAPNQCNVGKSVDLRITIDVLELCDVAEGEWKAWADRVRESRTEIQKGFDKRDTVKEHI